MKVLRLYTSIIVNDEDVSRKWIDKEYTDHKHVKFLVENEEIIIETWKHKNLMDEYVMYHPKIGVTNTEAVYLVKGEDNLNSLIEASKQLAVMVVRLYKAFKK